MKNVTIAPSANAQRLLDAKQSAMLAQLVDATPAQIHTWLANNVTSLAQARDVLEALLLAVRYVYKRTEQ